MIGTAGIVQRALDLGFARAGVCDAAPTRRADALHEWISEGRHGQMAYLERHLDILLDPEKLLAGARSIICVADRYWRSERAAVEPHSPGEGAIARYARGEDYHKVMRRRLHQLADELRAEHPDHQFRVCVDTAPLLEREYAARAGLGAIGKHTLLIEQGVGSYLLLGEIVTTLELQATESKAAVDPCESCTRCLDACPTQAIAPWSVDASRCISYLTIEHRELTDARFDGAIGQWIFGCDICQEVCPHNYLTRSSRNATVHAAYAPRRSGFDLLQVLGWTEADRRSAFTTSALKRAKLPMMQRNAVIAAGNARQKDDDRSLRSGVESLAGHDVEPVFVRETAGRVLARWDGSHEQVDQ